jgi:hypothetical protein
MGGSQLDLPDKKSETKGVSMKTTRLGAALFTACLASAGSLAAQFDGTVPLSCETKEVQDCESGKKCIKQTAEQASVAKSLAVDIANKTIKSVYRTEPLKILETDITDERIALQGHERWVVWSAVLRQKDGSMTIAIADRKGAFVLNGKCAPAKDALAASAAKPPGEATPAEPPAEAAEAPAEAAETPAESADDVSTENPSG